VSGQKTCRVTFRMDEDQRKRLEALAKDLPFKQTLSRLVEIALRDYEKKIGEEIRADMAKLLPEPADECLEVDEDHHEAPKAFHPPGKKGPLTKRPPKGKK